MSLFYKRITLVAMAVASFIGLHWYDRYRVQPSWNEERLDLGMGSLAVTALVAIFSALFVWMISSWAPTVKGGLNIYGNRDVLFKKVGLFIILGFHLYFSLIYFYDPRLFDVLQREDRIVEFFQALFCFSGAALLFITAGRYFENGKGLKSFYFWVPAAMAFAFLVIGFEEVSWFQRVFSLETPAILSANDQNELNIHNLATDTFEKCYYFGAFFAFILFPFLCDRLSLGRRWKIIERFAPGTYIIFVSSLAAAYNYDLWIYFQAAFFIALFVMCFYAFSQRGNLLLKAFCVLYFLLQAMIIALGGDIYSCKWILEYKELFITLAMVAYSVEVTFDHR